MNLKFNYFLLVIIFSNYSYGQVEREVSVDIGNSDEERVKHKTPVQHQTNSHCAQLNSNGQWSAVECSYNNDCGEKNPLKYPWVVLIYKQGKYNAMNDYKTKENAEQQMKFWEHFDNNSWPRFSNTSPNQYRYYGPFRKCDSPIPQFTANKILNITRPYIDDWKDKLKEAYKIIYQRSDYSTNNSLREYMRGLKNAEESVKNLENVLNNFTDESLSFIKENIGNLYESGNQMNEAKKSNYSLLPYAPPGDKVPAFANDEVSKRNNGFYFLNNRYSIKYQDNSMFLLSEIKIVGNSTILFFESTNGGKINKGNINEFYIVDQDGFKYNLISVNGVTPNVSYNHAIRFNCVFKGRLNKISGPFNLIEGKNVSLKNDSGLWWNIYGINLN